jgi:predicted ATPase
VEAAPFGELAARTVHALADWHERNGEHGRLCPEAVLVGRGTVERARIVIVPPRDPPRRAYLAPEQIGLSGRGIDERTDLYALGVMFYELVTGRPPFEGLSTPDWVRWRVAGWPATPGELAAVPVTLAQIVLRLLATAPEDRYRTASGLAADLDRCCEELRGTGRIGPFALGAADHPGRLTISGRMYGRQQRLSRLTAVFDRVATEGGPHLVCITGPAGVGKSTLAAALTVPAVAAGGWALTGRFSGGPWAAPYVALVQALSRPFDLLSGEPDERLAEWRHRFDTSLGLTAAALLDLIPGAEAVLDRHRPWTPAPAGQAAHRLGLAVRRLLAELAGPNSPSLLVLDDLQWADEASLRVLTELLSDPDTRHLLVVATYRPKDVSRRHPLHGVLADLSRRGLSSVVELRPLPDSALMALLGDTLGAGPETALPLAHRVARKTGSNPLLVGQFLHLLHSQELLRFDRSGWTCQLEGVCATSAFDSTVSAVLARVQRLEPGQRHLLRMAALIGDELDPPTLAAVTGRPVDDIVDSLRAATREHLLSRVDDAGTHLPAGPCQARFRWLHGQVRQAAMSLTPGPELAARHRSLAETLAARGYGVYDLARHLNAAAGRHRIDIADRIRLAERNLAAGMEANTVGAPEAARRHFAEALRRLPSSAWTSRYELMFALHVQAALAEGSAGAVGEAHRLVDVAVEHAVTDLNLAELSWVRATVLCAHGDTDSMTAAALAGLARAGLDVPVTPAEAVDAVTREVHDRLAALSEDEVVSASPATDRRAVVTARLIACLLVWGRMTEERRRALAAVGVRLALDHGPTPESCAAFACLGGYAPGDDAARRCLGIALRLLEELPAPRFEARVRTFAATALPSWYEAPAAALEALRRAYGIGLEHGDVGGAALGRVLHCQHLFVLGTPLRRVAGHVDEVRSLFDRYGLDVGRDVVDALAARLITLDGSAVTGPAVADASASRDGFGVTAGDLTCRIMTAYVLGEYAEALRLCREHEKLTRDAPIGYLATERHFYHALSLVAVSENAGPDERDACAARLAAIQELLDEWSARGPIAFGHKALLVSAERARLAGDAAQAMGRYDRALGQAKEFGLVHLEGLAAERAATFARDRDEFAEAATYLRRARGCSLRWGARGAVERVDQQLTALRRPARPSRLVDQLDLLAVVKAFQAVTGELDLDKVLATLLELLVQHAGAERGCLLLPDGDHLRVGARAEVDGDRIAVTYAPAGDIGEHVPVSIVQYVQRTGELVAVGSDDARANARDPYLAFHRPRSVLCAPITRHQELVAVLYLEHGLLSDAFTPAYLSTLELLCTQAAVALENATVHARLEATTRLLEATVDDLPVGLVLLNPDLTVRRASPPAQRLCGGAIATGTPLRELPLAVHRDFWAMVTAVMTGHSVREQCDIEAPIPLRVSMSPVYDDARGLVALAMSVSER